MAFQTNHTAPGDFVADAQLKDGSSLGTWLWFNLGSGTGTQNVTLRARKIGRNDRFAVERKLGTGDWTLVGRESLRMYAETAPPTAADNAAPDVSKTYTNMQAWLDYVASTAELQALGYATGGPIPATPNSFLIPFTMDANGKVKPYYEPIDPAKQQQELTDLLKSSLVSANSQFLGASATADAPTTPTSTAMSVVKVVLIVSGIVGLGVLIYKLATK